MRNVAVALLIFAWFFSSPVFPQVAVSNDGSPADSSAMLDIQSTEMGFLPPRLSEVQKLQINNPAEGLIIYNTTRNAIEVFNGSTWVSIREDGLSMDPLNHQVAIGGAGDDEAYDVFQDIDGSIFIAGTTSSYGAGNDDMYVVKLKDDFTLDDDFGVGGTLTIGGGNVDIAWSVAPASDGGYVIGGYTLSYGMNGWDFYLAKINGEGVLDNNFGSGGTRTIGLTHNDRAYCLRCTSTGGYILTGYQVIPSTTNYEGYLVRVTATGALDSGFGTNGTFRIGGSSSEFLMTVIETNDNGYLAVGQTNSYDVGGTDIYVIKLTSGGAPDNSFGTNGTLVLGGAGDESARDVAQTSDGGYLLVGSTNSYGVSNNDFYFVKLTGSGALDTGFGTNGTLTAGGSGNDVGRSVLLNSDGSILAGGYTNSFGAGGYDFYIMKMSPAGVPDSTFGTNGFLTIGGTGDDELYSMCHDASGGYLLAGATASFGVSGTDIYLVRINQVGGNCGNDSYGGQVTGNGGTAGSGGETGSGGSISSGGTTGSGGTLTTICN